MNNRQKGKKVSQSGVLQPISQECIYYVIEYI